MHRQSTQPHIGTAWLAWLSVALLAGISAAQDSTNPAETADAQPAAKELAPPEAAEPTADADHKQPAPAHADPAKSRKVSAGLAAVAGIAVFGVGSIAIVMLWARRLRRLARDPGPRQNTLGNDFWFLKPPKPAVSSSDVVERSMSSGDAIDSETTE